MHVCLSRLLMFFCILNLTFLYHTYGFYSSKGNFNRSKTLKPKHRFCSFFDKPMILLYNIVQIFDLTNFNFSLLFTPFIASFKGGVITSAFININFGRSPVILYGFSKKGQGCFLVSSFSLVRIQWYFPLNQRLGKDKTISL